MRGKSFSERCHGYGKFFFKNIVKIRHVREVIYEAP